MRRMGGNIKLIRKLISRFAETQADAMARIVAAIDAGDIPTAAREVHTIKGLAGNIGATQLLALSAQLEAVLNQNHMAAVDGSLAAWKQEFCTVLTQITNAIGASEAAATVATAAVAGTPLGIATRFVVEREVFTRQLQQLAVMLANNDTRAAKLADSMAETLDSFGQGLTAKQLNKLIADYEFEEAASLLSITVRAFDRSL
jgi:two-component system sensor histidine kinase/response regulator